MTIFRWVTLAFVCAGTLLGEDLGAVDSSFDLPGLILHLKQTPQQQRALERLLADQQNPATPDFHRWLTPEQFADRFGANTADIAKLTAWLQGQGFSIGHVSRGRRWIVFHGDAGKVRSSFHTNIHRYRSNGEMHYANSGDPVIPGVLTDLVSSIGGLDDYAPIPDSHSVSPLETFTNGAHALVPGDYATIFDINPLYDAGIDGTGQKIAIAGESDILLSDIQTFRTTHLLPSQTPQLMLVPDFPDPGTTGALHEAYLDLEWSGAIARSATVIYVYSTNAFNAAAYAIDQNLAPVLSVSFSVCEAFVGSAAQAQFRSMAQQANAQGITWVNSNGDAGAAACDPNGATVAQDGFAIRFPASTPEITAVGGTQLNDTGGDYWNTTNGADGSSALGYIPEIAWNDVAVFKSLWATGGGASIFFLKPVWQSGPGVPNDGLRDTPDVALPASSHNPYVITSLGKTWYEFGTSCAAPSFAGMLTLLNQYVTAHGMQAQPGLGNVNIQLYQLAQSNPAAFHDVTAGNNAVPCAAGSPNCVGGMFGEFTGVGYDLVTGLGSPDLANLISGWSTKAPTASLVEISLDQNPVTEQQPDASGHSWNETFTLTEEAGVATTLTDFTVNGTSLASTLSTYFSSTAIPAHGSISARIGFENLTPAVNQTFGFSGMDANGQTWTRQISIPFVGFPPIPTIAGSANGASFEEAYAPGMVLSIFGTELATGTQQAEALPLIDFLQNFSATVNGYIAPIYYVSPGQVNIQIPYGVQPGPAMLVVFNGDQVAISTIQIAASAPGIFVDGNGATVPYGSGKAGDTLVLYITGEGEVTPALATGSAPSSTTTVSNLPKPVLPVTMTIGGVNAPIAFVGIPYGLVGVTQINFTVPAGLAPGKQPVVVTVGNVPGTAANFTVE